MMMNHYNQMKKSNPTNPMKGPGFANAMFAIKDMQAEYDMFNGSPVVPPKVVPSLPKKNVVAVSAANKPASTNKSQPVTVKNPIVMQQKGVGSNVGAKQFKIAPGKQFQNFVKFMPLNIVPCTKGVSELTEEKGKTNWQYNLFCQGVPANQIVQKPEVSFNFSAEDIRQGQLGNCYFVTALASIAHCSQVLRARIPKFREYGQKTTTFEVNLFESGKCISIMVDNLFPNIYCKPVINDISPMILEKAYAQSYGNFQVINIGHANDALRDLTGASTVYLDFKSKEQFRNRIKQAFVYGFAVVIASKTKNQHPSLSPMHSYNVLGCEQIKGEVFLRLRDPRGWTKACFDVPSQLVNNADNGTFWIDEKNLQQSFEVVTICKVMKNYEYFFKAFGMKELVNNRGALSMRINAPTRMFISIHQKHKKFFDQNFSYEIIKILVAEVETGKNNFEIKRTVKADFNAQQVCAIEVELQPGNYMILGEMGKKKGKQYYPKEVFTISVYSQRRDIQFELVTGNIDVRPFLVNYIRQNKTEFQQSFTEQGIYKYMGPLFGYVCMYYQNRGKKNAIENIEYTVVKNVEIGQRKVQLSPGASKLLIHAIGSQKNCSYKFSTSSKTMYG